MAILQYTTEMWDVIPLIYAQRYRLNDGVTLPIAVRKRFTDE